MNCVQSVKSFLGLSLMVIIGFCLAIGWILGVPLLVATLTHSLFWSMLTTIIVISSLVAAMVQYSFWLDDKNLSDKTARLQGKKALRELNCVEVIRRRIPTIRSKSKNVTYRPKKHIVHTTSDANLSTGLTYPTRQNTSSVADDKVVVQS